MLAHRCWRQTCNHTLRRQDRIGAGLLALALLYYFTSASRPRLFWIAFVLTRPLGAVVGDSPDKPYEDGGLELNRYIATAILMVLIVGAIHIFPQRPAEESH